MCDRRGPGPSRNCTLGRSLRRFGDPGRAASWLSPSQPHAGQDSNLRGDSLPTISRTRPLRHPGASASIQLSILRGDAGLEPARFGIRPYRITARTLSSRPHVHLPHGAPRASITAACNQRIAGWRGVAPHARAVALFASMVKGNPTPHPTEGTLELHQLYACFSPCSVSVGLPTLPTFAARHFISRREPSHPTRSLYRRVGLVRLEGFEPPTFRFVAGRSFH